MTSRVFVPLVGADGSGQQLFEAIASADAPEPHPAKLMPQISELHDFGLYRSGQSVREAVVRFTERRRGEVWLGRRNARAAPWHLRISDLQVGRLSEENARSAGLGLTVAALLESFGKPPAVVFATGEVRLPQEPGALAVGVGAVDGIRGKLGLIGDYLSAHRAMLVGREIHVLLPSEAVDGRPIADAEGRALSRLRDAARGYGLDLRISMLGSLDDLDGIFGRFSLDPVVSRSTAAGVGAVLGLAAAIGIGWSVLTNAPVHLSWVSPDGATTDVEPRRARYVAETDRLELLARCVDDQRQPVMVGGETLVLRVTARDDVPWASRLAPPRFFIASVSRAADPVVLDAALFRTAGDVTPGALTDAIAAVPIEPIEDEVRLFVVATRETGTDLSQVTAELRAQLTNTEGAAALSTTAQFLKDRFDGMIDYQFRVTTDATRCP